MRKPCCDKQDTNKGAWSKQEDEKLIDYIRKHGEGCWRTLPQAAGLLRCGKSCRLRWINYLRPDLKRGNFAEDEEDLIIKLHALLGNRWSLIAGRLPGRTDNEVKNYWNSHLSRKLIKMGFDPNNHRPGQNDNVVPRPQTCTPSNSSAGLNLASARAPLKPISRISNENNSDNSNTNNNDQKSDARSSVEDEQEQQLSHGHDDELPDLNLDLAISINVSSPSKSVAECSRRRGCGCDVDGESNLPTEIHEVASCRSPTLLLFQ